MVLYDPKFDQTKLYDKWKSIMKKKQKFAYRDRAFEILEEHNKKEPFFMYFSSQNCHLPNQVYMYLYEYPNKLV